MRADPKLLTGPPGVECGRLYPADSLLVPCAHGEPGDHPELPATRAKEAERMDILNAPPTTSAAPTPQSSGCPASAVDASKVGVGPEHRSPPCSPPTPRSPRRASPAPQPPHPWETQEPPETASL